MTQLNVLFILGAFDLMIPLFKLYDSVIVYKT